MKKIEEIQDISELHLDNRSVAIVTAHSHSPYTERGGFCKIIQKVRSEGRSCYSSERKGERLL